MVTEMEQPLHEKDIALARDAGASAEFLAVASTLPGLVDGADHNSAAIGLKKDIRLLDAVTSDELRKMRRQHGGFYNALWEGDLADAFIRADGSNTALLLHVFSPEYIIERGIVHEGHEPEYINRLISERAQRR